MRAPRGGSQQAEDAVAAAQDAAAVDAGCVTAALCPQPDAPCRRAVCKADGACGMEDADGSTRDDGLACTINDRCKAGQCVAGPDICECAVEADCAPFEDGNACNGTLYCNTDKKPHRCQVLPSSIVSCDSGGDTPCSRQACVATTGKCAALPRPDGTPCVDDDPCSVDSSCKAGKCTAHAKSWCECETQADCAAFEDGDACNGMLYCDLSHFPHTCRVSVQTVVKCAPDKDTQCMTNTCDKDKGTCAMSAAKDGTPCNDGDKQTLADVCQATKDGGSSCNGTNVLRWQV